MKNEEMMTKVAPRSLGKSLDELREDVLGLADDIAELYDLDDDTWKLAQSMKLTLDGMKKRVDALQVRVNRNRGRMVLGFIGLGGLVYLGYKAIDQLANRVQKLEDTDPEGKKAEESDG